MKLPQTCGVVLAATALMLHADECKFWDYSNDPNTVTGGSEQQCQTGRAKIAQYLSQQLGSAHQNVQQFLHDTLNHPATTPDQITKRSAERGKLDHAVDDAQRAWATLPNCTCRMRGESELEKTSRETRQRQESQAGTLKTTSSQGQNPPSDTLVSAPARIEPEQPSPAEAAIAELERLRAERDLQIALAELGPVNTTKK